MIDIGMFRKKRSREKGEREREKEKEKRGGWARDTSPEITLSPQRQHFRCGYI